MTPRDRFNATLGFKKADRLPFMEFMGFWPETIERWEQEGLPPGKDPKEHFGFDPFEFLPIDFNFQPPFEVEVLEEDESTRTVRDVTGVVKREFKHGSEMPHYIEFPMKKPADFYELKERLVASDLDRYPADWNQRVLALRERDYPVGLVCRGLLAFFRDFMDFNTMLVSFMEEPEWVAEVMDFHTDFMITLWDKVTAELEVDLVLLGEDMAFKTGPMVPPEWVAEFMVPRYRKLTDFLRQRGVRNLFVDSDGDVRTLVPLFLEGGVTGVLPLENNSNSDPVELRLKHRRLGMIGGVDKLAIARGAAAVDRELKRVLGNVGPTGGYIPSFDHSVHPDVSYRDYALYAERLYAWCEAAAKD
jgi:uroporphyrinogen decarboxylase